MAEQEGIRLQKFLADAGLCSRREAEDLIRDGEVRINGRVAQLGDRVDPETDRVTASGFSLGAQTSQPKVTVAVNKPRGLICSNRDPHHERTVFDLLPPRLRRLRLFCAGRLDKESEGLVILTSDGALAQRLTHPSAIVIKHYRVSLKTPIPRAKLERLLKGIRVEGELLKVERARLIGVGHPEQSEEVDVQLHHGKKREIRRLFLFLGFPVRRLKRYRIGAFTLRGIPLRGAKILSTKEIDLLLQAGET